MLRADNPDLERLERAEQTALDYFEREGRWLGEGIKSSLAMGVSSETSPLSGDGFYQLEPYLFSPQIWVSFRSVSQEDFDSILEKEPAEKVDEELSSIDKFTGVERLEMIYNSARREILRSNFSFDGTFKGMEPLKEEAKRHEEVLFERDDFEIKSVSLTGRASGDNVSEVYECFQEDLEYKINVEYSVSDDVVEDSVFASIVLGNGLHLECCSGTEAGFYELKTEVDKI